LLKQIRGAIQEGVAVWPFDMHDETANVPKNVVPPAFFHAPRRSVHSRLNTTPAILTP